MTSTANLQSHLTHCPLTLLPVLIVLSYYFLVSSFILIGCTSVLTFAQSNDNATEQFPVSTLASTLLQTTSTGKPVANSNVTHVQQPKTLKFTLIAGKFWKFNIKANSFSSHKEGQLRLHKNVSLNNYIIDDEGWFQYNPQQQQLFAWPSLNIKPGTYQFVLLPSEVDIEANSENTVANLNVAANIIVELIRPLYLGFKSEIDQYIDHKFSLEYLHRHPSYTLLLHEIVSVFKTISTKSSSNISNLAQQIFTTPATPQQQKGLELSNKLGDYVLINFNYTSDGDLFSLTWSTHPAIAINSTITPIVECRINSINETVSRLSSLSSGYQISDEKFAVYYPLNASLVNSLAIVSTERGNHTLKLNLNGPCQKVSIIEELVAVSSSSNDGLVVDIDDKDNSIDNKPVEKQQTSVVVQLNSANSAPGLPNPEAIDSDTAAQTTKLTTSTTAAPEPQPSTNTSPEPTLVTKQTQPVSPLESDQSSQPPTSTQATTVTADAALSEPALTLNSTESKVNNRSVVEAQVFKKEGQPVFQNPQPKTQPQAKSLANYLDSDVPSPKYSMSTTNLTASLATTTVVPQTMSNFTRSLNNITSSESTSTDRKDANLVPETTLNEDFMGIVNEVMDYLLSIAVPLSIIVGTILLASITFALCHLCVKRRKSKQFQVKNRFSFRYGSERRAFLKTSSKPVILEADQKSISMGGTPQHQFAKKSTKSEGEDKRTSYFPLHHFTSSGCDGSSAQGDCGGG